jgi:hypothetical protein
MAVITKIINDTKYNKYKIENLLIYKDGMSPCSKKDSRSLNWKETRKLLRFYYHSDPIVSSTIDWVCEFSVNIISKNNTPELIPGIDGKKWIEIALDFWLFGNTFFDNASKILWNPDLIRANVSLKKYDLLNESGGVIKENAPILHIRRLRHPKDVMGCPLPLVDDAGEFVGFTGFNPDELLRAVKNPGSYLTGRLATED